MGYKHNAKAKQYIDYMVNEACKDHVAILIKNYNSVVVEWKNPTSSHYYIRYEFIERDCTLVITGDLGHLIAKHYNNMKYETFLESYALRNVEDFVNKILCSEREKYEFDHELFKKELADVLKIEYSNVLDNEQIEELIDEIAYIIPGEGADNECVIDRVCGIFKDYELESYDVYDLKMWSFGQSVAVEMYLYLKGFELAMEYLDKHGKSER